MSEMKEKIEVYDLVVDIPGLKLLVVELGPLVPLGMVHRLVKRSRNRIYVLARQGRFKVVSVMGGLFVPVRDVERYQKGLK